MNRDLDVLWRSLQSLERQVRTAVPHEALRGADWFDDWRARVGRVQRVRDALFLSGPVAGRILAERISGIDISLVGDILLSACKDVALYWGGSVLLGSAAGAAVGSFGFGVGAIPGAMVGAGVGAQMGAWVLGVLGLKSLVEDLGAAVPQALRHYERGFKLAWGPVRRWEADEGTDRAPDELAAGHVVLVVAMLSALAAYLTRGRGDPGAKARILQDIRESPRLGPRVADWVAANEDRLVRHPALKPREQQVMMSAQGKPAAGPPVTPSQMRPGKAGAEPPAITRTPAPPQLPKVADGPTNVVARDAVDLAEFRRLNVIDTAKGKLAPGEAGAAAELQHYLGGSLERIKTADSKADFLFSSGPHQGKTVDFMFTPNDFSSAAKANQFFEKNLARNEAQLKAHLEKADLVPMDFRFLSPQNQKLFVDVIERLPVEQQSRIIILR